MEEIAVFPLEVVLVIANIVSVAVPADVYITIWLLFSLACFSE